MVVETQALSQGAGQKVLYQTERIELLQWLEILIKCIAMDHSILLEI
jgi:hypothetical protein